ncbi:hypothetical protein [Enterococcus cecorum]
MQKKFEIWRLKQIYYGDTPEKILKTNALLLESDEIVAILRINRRKLSNAINIQKIFWLIISIVPVTLFSVGILMLKGIAQTLPNALSKLVGVFFITLIGYMIFIITIAIIIQSLKNSTINRIEILEEVLAIKQKV